MSLNSKPALVQGQVTPTSPAGMASLENRDTPTRINTRLEKRIFRTDLGNARRLVQMHRDSLRYCHAYNKWLYYDWQKWVIDEIGMAHRYAKDMLMCYLAASKNANKSDDGKHAVASQSVTRINAMLKLAQSEPGIAILPNDLDSDSMLLNVKNGTINLTDGKLRAAKREDLISKMANVEFDAAAECPIWKKFIDEITVGNEELARYLQKVAGYALTGETGEQCLFVYRGDGANGKSTQIDVLRELLGGYACRAAPDLLVSSGGMDRHPTELAMLAGARLVVCSEVDENRKWANQRIKEMTGEKTITARRMREDFWTFKNQLKIVITVNHLPDVGDTTRSFWRRMKVIPFDYVVPDHAIDPKLQDKLTKELPGILNWAIEGCLSWQREGLREPPVVLKAIKQYRDSSDTFGIFIDEACATGATLSVRSAEFYDAYQAWCEARAEVAMDGKKFKRSLLDRGFRPKKRSDANYFEGITLSAISTE